MRAKDKLKQMLQEAHEKRNPHKTLADLPEPDLIPGLSEAAEKIVQNLHEGKKMLIVGDYDADGVGATTILYSFLNEAEFGNQVFYIVPDRFIDGYGVSKNMIDYALNNNLDFIVTVDNGIKAIEAINYANENGIEVIITDHHTPGEELPKADIIVDLKLNQGNFPYVEISGATIAWYLCAQIRQILDLPIDLRKYIDIVAITVISDVMPLEDINLIFYYYGLNLMKRKHRALYEYIFDSYELENLNEESLGFKLVPMINAAGRIEHAHRAIELFLAKSINEIKEKVGYLKMLNEKRKLLTQELLNAIQPQIEAQKEERVIVVKHETLHEGIVGILAGKIAEKYNKPSYVFGWNSAKQCWKGSGRTTGDIHLYELTKAGDKYALGYGGHKGAVGVAIDIENFDLWREIIQEEGRKIDLNKFFDFESAVIDIPLAEVDKELVEIIEQFRPYGEGFELPVLQTQAWIVIQDSYKNGLHWKCRVFDDYGRSFTAWFFHNQDVRNYNNTQQLIKFIPKVEKTTIGTEIILHCKV